MASQRLLTPVHSTSLGIPSLALDCPSFLSYGVYLGEIVAPILIIIGLYTRLGGLMIFVNMIFAIALAHSAELLTLGKHGGWALELQAFYLFGGLVIMLLGSGKIAIKPD